MTMTISKQVHQKEGVVDILELTVIGDLGRRVVEAKYLENRRLVEVNDQVLRAGINQRKRLASGNVLR
ncbi:hypothetical protein Bca52824_063459 [Brassica carinata]|uniref:Uncharacterized protein n=1 Tax=Brassica carinata TaxID=52824 RepID=A0A8X7U879_BRACI|nr:hypothetical protein Bca52824_063459 [Brassica carinata]